MRTFIMPGLLIGFAALGMSSNYPSLDSRKVDGLVFEQGNFDDDDETEILMANRWLQLVVEPAHGGAISSVYYRPAALEFTKRSVQDDWGGLFRNVIDGNPSKMDWYMAPFDVEIIRHTPELAVLQLSAPGRSGAYTGVTLSKRFTLTDDSARLQVDYQIHNDPISVEPLPFAMRMHNAVGVAGRTGYLFWPVERGIWRQEQPGGHYIWEPNPTRGFCGYATDDGDGLALRMEYRLLRQFYYWAEHGTLPRSTLEWYMNELPVPAGGSVATSVYVLPFADIVEPSGVTDELVGRIDTSAVTAVNTAGEVVIELASAVSGKRQAVVQVRRLPDGEARIVSDSVLPLQAGEKTVITVPVTVSLEGTHEVVLDLRHDGRPAGELLAPMIVGHAHVPYAVVPQEERYAPLAAPMLPKDFTFSSRAVATPHVPWAKHYAGGSTSFFLLTDGYVQREAIELAQRFEMAPAASFLTPALGWATYALGGYEGRISEQDLVGELEKTFAKNERVDALLLSGPIWQWLTPWMKGAVIARVQAGTGLVWISPAATGDDIGPLLPLARAAGTTALDGHLQATRDHFITRGLPWPLIEGMQAYPGVAGEGSEVLATIGDGAQATPLVAVGRIGEGRVVVINANVRPTAWSGHNLTPVRQSDPPHHNHEYELSLVGRALIWAAGHEASAALRASAADGVLEVVVESAQSLGAKLSVTCRDRFSNIIEAHDLQLDLVAGETRAQLALPVLPNGLNAVECILTADGATLDWHTVAVASRQAADIASFSADRAVYDRGDPVVLYANLTGSDTSQQLRVTVRDAWGRAVWRREKAAAAGIVSFDLPIPRPSSLRLEALAELMNTGGGVLAVARATIDYRYIMQPDDMMVSFGFQGVSQGGTPPYLMKPFYDALISAGANGWFHKPGNNRPEELDATRAANLPIQLTSGPLHPGKTVIDSNLRQKYEQTGDATYLTRSPLIGEEFEGNLRRNVEQMAATTSIQWGSFDFYNGDESIYQPADIDLSFDAVSLAAFRQWLQAQYPSLTALNQTWQTAFESWEAVTPMTRDKVVHHSSWAPWLDHRLFGDYVLARAYRLAREDIAELLPGMRSGASGTTNTEAMTNWNWWLMRDSFSSLQPYGGDQTYQQRAFMLDVPQAGWLGYGEMEVSRYTYKIWRWLSFGSMRGINIFSGRNNVNPDLTLPPTAKAFRAALETASKGQGRALFLAKPELDPIAYHYSPRSLWTAIPFGIRSQRQASSDGMTDLLTDANLQSDYIAYEQVENGRLPEAQYKLLFLRASTSLSEAESEAMREFVNGGGVLVADLLPGVLDAHGNRRDGGCLDDVFGISQAGTIVAGRGTLDAAGGAHGIELETLHLEVECATPLQITTATALGQWQIEGQSGPALTINQFGDGLAICLGTDMLGGYTSARSIRHLERGRQILGAFERFRDSLFAVAGIEPVVKVTDGAGKLLPIQVFRLSGKQVSFVSLFGETRQRKAYEATVHLPQPAHVFDLISGAAIAAGKVDSFPQTIGAYDCHVFALLDALPGSLTIEAPKFVKQGAGAAIEIAVMPVERAPVDYALRLEVTAPDGTDFRPLTRNLTAVHGKARIDFDAALDEQPGRYDLLVRNVLTGATATATMALRQ